MKVGTSIEGWWAAAPAGYLLEDGAAVSRITYDDLFALIGTTYGVGNGSTTFNLPNSKGRVAVNKGSAPFATIGSKSGVKTEIMTITEMPVHSHPQNVSALSGGSAVRNDYKADAAGGIYSQGQDTAVNGSSSAYNVIQPSITKSFAIKY
ncbi:tail fiber protein [Candidatus Saccharibacteria bacterium]|nr:tail fiber protein [Candidatus Saccharibacteria bacterium]